MLHLGLIGYPLDHSLSPVLHEYLLKAFDIEGEYTLYETPPGCAGQGLKIMQTYGVSGFNVTIPHKIEILSHLDYLDDTAKLLKAVNTVSIVNGQYRGYNTDFNGFIKSLPAHFNGKWKDISVLILGTGGVVRPVLAALIEKNVKSIRLAVRKEIKAGEAIALGQVYKKHYKSQTNFDWVKFKDLQYIDNYSLIINATPVGMSPNTKESLLSSDVLQTANQENTTVMDLIYNPLETQLMRNATACGLHAYNGLDMLVYQGVNAFEFWTGKKVADNLIPELKTYLSGQLP